MKLLFHMNLRLKMTRTMWQHSNRLTILTKLENIMGDLSRYRIDEIKYRIDTAIQRTMYENNEEEWEYIMKVQSYLYEEFGIEE